MNEVAGRKADTGTRHEEPAAPAAAEPLDGTYEMLNWSGYPARKQAGG